jgi:hypothetical protein
MVSCRISPPFPRRLISNHVRSVSSAWPQRFGYLARITVQLPPLSKAPATVLERESEEALRQPSLRARRNCCKGLLFGCFASFRTLPPAPSLSCQPLVLVSPRARCRVCMPLQDQTSGQARKATLVCKPHNVRGPHSSPCSNGEFGGYFSLWISLSLRLSLHTIPPQAKSPSSTPPACSAVASPHAAFVARPASCTFLLLQKAKSSSLSIYLDRTIG